MTPLPSPPTAAGHAPARRSRRKDARPGELLDAALDLFVEHGYAATRVEAVAQRAGVSKGTLFRYFASKEALFQAVVHQHLVGLLDKWSATIDGHAGASADLLRASLLQWWERVGASRASGITKLVLTEASQFPELGAFYQQEVIARGHALLRRILQRGMASGEFRPLNVEHSIQALTAPMLYLIVWKHSLAPCVPAQAALDPAQFIDAQIDLLLNGLLSARPHPCPVK